MPLVNELLQEVYNTLKSTLCIDKMMLLISREIPGRTLTLKAKRVRLKLKGYTVRQLFRNGIIKRQLRRGDQPSLRRDILDYFLLIGEPHLGTDSGNHVLIFSQYLAHILTLYSLTQKAVFSDKNKQNATKIVWQKQLGFSLWQLKLLETFEACIKWHCESKDFVQYPHSLLNSCTN